MSEIGFVVDLPAVGFCDECADELPGDFGRGDVGAALRDSFNPSVDDVSGAFILDGVSYEIG